MRLPIIWSASAGQASAQHPKEGQSLHKWPPASALGSIFRGQSLTHVRQSTQRSVRRKISGEKEIPSGLWHQRQCSGHPFRNTAVRIPGPSWTENLRISNTIPEVIFSSSTLDIILPDIAFLNLEAPVHILHIARCSFEVGASQSLDYFRMFGHRIEFPFFYIR